MRNVFCLQQNVRSIESWIQVFVHNLTFESESSNDLDSKLSGWNRIKLVKFTRNNLTKIMASKFRFILHSECLYVLAMLYEVEKS